MTSSGAGRVVFAGENPLITLYSPDTGATVAVASLWRARHTERGAGTSLLIWADPAATGLGDAAPAGIFTDNLPLADWLWDTFNRRWEPLLGHGLEDAPPRPAQFVEVAAGHEHRVTCRSGDITVDLVWRRPLPSRWTETFPYEYRTTAVIVPCLDADIVVNGVAAAGEVRPHADEFVSSAVLAFCETWVRDA
jgi:hypothetical protein